MTISKAMTAAENSDAELVAQSLNGNREAFGLIVTRYQSLICSLAYSGIGGLGQSEDVAQETFITAWKHLRHLREPSKLRSWLCGIARNRINNFLRREGREPLRHAEELGAVESVTSVEPQPPEQAITHEEAEILWRAVGRIPESYREPLILFYREGHSVERVALSLELSEDAVKQRLSRGRKLLQEQVLSFVEGALEKTNPGKAFTIGVLAALPAFSMTAKAAALGATAAKGGAAAKATAVSGLLGAFLSFPMAILGNYAGYRMSLAEAQSDRERRFVKGFYGRLFGCILGFFVAYGLLMIWARPLLESGGSLFTVLLVGLAMAYLVASLSLAVWLWRRRRRVLSEIADDASDARATKPAWEYRSQLEILGWPLVHIRVGGGLAAQRKPVKAWIAAGDCAIGLLFAFGGMAIAPFSMGGCAIGLVPFGGMAVGPLAIGGFAVGIWSFGGLALGWEAFGGCAVAWHAATGGVAVARDFAMGGIAQATHANEQIAQSYRESNLFFRASTVAVRYLAWLNLLWVFPMIFWWRTTAKAARRAAVAN
jgi:RNA polymerase sigma factor (sigma-70 family)